MRTGIFSDVHSNLEALEAVLELLRGEGITHYLCGGDLVGYGADPIGCIQKIRSLAGRVIGGNHDWASVGLMDLDYFNPYAREAILWTEGVLDEASRRYLKSLQILYTSGEITLVHGSLNEPEQFEYITDAESAKESLEQMTTTLCFVGHSHLPMILSIDEKRVIRTHPEAKVKMIAGRRYLVNVGSVGQPRDGDPRCACAIFDSDARTLEIRRTPYDIEKTQKKILKAGLPSFSATRLSVGR